jgi:hypothetical protein
MQEFHLKKTTGGLWALLLVARVMHRGVPACGSVGGAHRRRVGLAGLVAQTVTVAVMALVGGLDLATYTPHRNITAQLSPLTTSHCTSPNSAPNHNQLYTILPVTVPTLLSTLLRMYYPKGVPTPAFRRGYRGGSTSVALMVRSATR